MKSQIQDEVDQVLHRYHRQDQDRQLETNIVTIEETDIDMSPSGVDYNTSRSILLV